MGKDKPPFSSDSLVGISALQMKPSIRNCLQDPMEIVLRQIDEQHLTFKKDIDTLRMREGYDDDCDKELFKCLTTFLEFQTKTQKSILKTIIKKLPEIPGTLL